MGLALWLMPLVFLVSARAALQRLVSVVCTWPANKSDIIINLLNPDSFFFFKKKNPTSIPSRATIGPPAGFCRRADSGPSLYAYWVSASQRKRFGGGPLVLCSLGYLLLLLFFF